MYSPHVLAITNVSVHGLSRHKTSLCSKYAALSDRSCLINRELRRQQEAADEGSLFKCQQSIDFRRAAK